MNSSKGLKTEGCNVRWNTKHNHTKSIALTQNSQIHSSKRQGGREYICSPLSPLGLECSWETSDKPRPNVTYIWHHRVKPSTTLCPFHLSTFSLLYGVVGLFFPVMQSWLSWDPRNGWKIVHLSLTCKPFIGRVLCPPLSGRNNGSFR